MMIDLRHDVAGRRKNIPDSDHAFYKSIILIRKREVAQQKAEEQPAVETFHPPQPAMIR
jgi:hypothetical protein